MEVYAGGTVILNFLVDLLLLLGTNRLCGYPAGWPRCALAAALGSAHGAACLVTRLSFLGGTLWRAVCLGLMGSIAFGWSWGALRRCAVFVLLTLAMGGAAQYTGGAGLAGAAAAVFLMGCLGFRGAAGQRQYVPVRLCHRGKTAQLLALRDTGNMLRDSVTGEPVLVLDGRCAQRLTGLTAEQIASPVETVAQRALPGLRLMPYRAVGKSGGMLLALRLDSVEIGGKPAGRLVAFAPEGLDEEGTYQALAGGMA